MVGTGAQDDLAFALEEGVRQGTQLCKVSGAKLGTVPHNIDLSAGHAARGCEWLVVVVLGGTVRDSNGLAP